MGYSAVLGDAFCAALFSRASKRALSASASSLAFAAISFTASNSSRLTKSRPPIHSLARSRAAASASRPTPEIGRAHVCTPVTNAHLVCRLLLDKKTLHTHTCHGPPHPHTTPSTHQLTSSRVPTPQFT